MDTDFNQLIYLLLSSLIFCAGQRLLYKDVILKVFSELGLLMIVYCTECFFKINNIEQF